MKPWRGSEVRVRVVRLKGSLVAKEWKVNPLKKPKTTWKHWRNSKVKAKGRMKRRVIDAQEPLDLRGQQTSLLDDKRPRLNRIDWNWEMNGGDQPEALVKEDPRGVVAAVDGWRSIVIRCEQAWMLTREESNFAIGDSISGKRKVVSGIEGWAPDSTYRATRSTEEERGNCFIRWVILVLFVHLISL